MITPSGTPRGRRDKLREALADTSHTIWSLWMRWMFAIGRFNEDGTWTMPKELVKRWQRQMNTGYAELSEAEKDNDREQADKIMATIEHMLEAGMNNLSINLMETIVAIIHAQQADLQERDPTRLRLIEIAPRSEEFADSGLSCYICPNDPDEPDGWADEEITEPGKRYNAYSNKTMIEMSGGHYFNLRFTIFYTLFFNDLGISRKKAFEASRVMLDRIQRAIFDAGIWPGGKFGNLRHADDYGCKLVYAMNAVKKRRLIPSGSESETFYRGKMWLQFEVYMEG